MKMDTCEGLAKHKRYISCKHRKLSDEELAAVRLSKRLAYILRFGALKEGLEVDDSGYVDLEKLIRVSLLQDYTQQQVLDMIKTSVGYRHIPRFNWYEKAGKTFVRASYMRHFEKSPHHPGTNIQTLFECAMIYVLDHLDDYDLHDFPDEYIIRTMIHRLKRRRKLNSCSLEILLVPTLTHLNLEGVLLSRKILQMVWTQCPMLLMVSLRGCGYIVTDTMLEQLTKNLPHLQQLDICQCNHLTTKCLTILSKNLPGLQVLHISGVPSLTCQAVLDLIHTAKHLRYLDVYHLRTTTDQHQTLTTVAQDHGVQLVIKEPAGKMTQGLID